jgi:hypothetical protein
MLGLTRSALLNLTWLQLRNNSGLLRALRSENKRVFEAAYSVCGGFRSL